jgi:hypothetical protein
MNTGSVVAFDYDRKLAMYRGSIVAFIKDTQPEVWQGVCKRHGS